MTCIIYLQGVMQETCSW